MAARKTSSLPTRIWTYAARVEDDGVVFDALRRANRYYNALVEIERARHQRYQEIRRRHAPELAMAEELYESLDGQIDDLIQEQKKQRQERWQETGGEKRRLLDAEIQIQIDDLRKRMKALSAEAKTHRSAFAAKINPAREEQKRRSTERANGGGPRVKSSANAQVLEEMLGDDEWSAAWKEIARSDDEAHKAMISARASCRLATGTYLAVEEAVARAKKDSSPMPPRFRKFGRGGKLSVQLRDVTFADVLSGTRALSVRPKPNDPSRKGKPPFLVSLDQSVPRGERQQIEISIRHDRMPPLDASLKWAALVIKRVGERWTYEFQLTLEHPSFSEPKRSAGTRESDHVRIGWSRVDSGVRVASVGDHHVIVPDSILSQHDHASAIESAADLHFDRAKSILRRWMLGGPHRLTAWHRMQSDHARVQLRRWCFAYAEHVLGDPHRVWKIWREDRLSRGEDLYAPPWIIRRWLTEHGMHNTQQDVVAFWSYCWARKDTHLCQYAADSRRRFVNRRDDLFRREAMRIATEYADLTVDAYKISSLKELPSLTMPGDPVRDQAQHNAQAAAPGRFREILVEVMGPRCTPCERPGGGENAGSARNRKAASRRAGTNTVSVNVDVPSSASVDLSQIAS